MLHTIRSIIYRIQFIYILVSILVLICLMQVHVIIYKSKVNDKVELVAVDLSKAACNYSQNIGRRIFFHKCFKNKQPLYDIRHFFKNIQTLKADIIGTQLNQLEFDKLCEQCYI